jgi:Icc protein
MSWARDALLIGVTGLWLGGCLDVGDDRTRRDFDEVGHASLGGLSLYADPAVATTVDPASASVRFRANAPSVRLKVRSTEPTTRTIHVEFTNVFDHIAIENGPPLSHSATGAVSFDLAVPPEGVDLHLAAPGGDAPQPFRFAWVGDVQGGNTGFARVRDRIRADPTLEFVVFAGDVTDNGQPDQFDAFLKVANGLTVPWYSLLGNHEVLGTDGWEFQRRIGRINVAFDHRGARVLLLDSASGALHERVWAFLHDRLTGTEPKVRVAAMHVPPLDFGGLRDGGFDSRLEGAKAMAALADGGVDVLFCGHFHTLDISSAAGVKVVVSGTGGVENTAKWGGATLGYVAVSVDPGAGAVEVLAVEVP